MAYAAETWITTIENNIQTNYVMYVESYVNFVFCKKQVLKNLKDDSSLQQRERDARKYEFLKLLRCIKDDLLSVGGETYLTKDPDNCIWIDANKSLVLPNKTFARDSL